MPFKDILKRLRESHSLSQDELARLTKLSKSTISMYENGNREPKFETLELLADFFNVDMNTLLDVQQSSVFLSLSKEEEIIIKKYRQLDADGKERVDYVLNLEYKLAAEHAENKEERLG